MPIAIRSQQGGATAGSGVSTAVVTLPPTVESGDRIIVAVSMDGTTGAFTWPAGWTVRAAGADGSDTSRTEVAEKDTVSGSEDGTTINVGLTNTQQGGWRAWAISGAHASQAIEVSAIAQQAFGTTVNPNSVTASWGAEENLFFVIAGYDNGTRFVTGGTNDGYPANYTISKNNDRDNAAGGAGLASAFRLLSSASDDPGNVVIDTNDSLVAWTFVLRPAAAGDPPIEEELPSLPVGRNLGSGVGLKYSLPTLVVRRFLPGMGTPNVPIVFPLGPLVVHRALPGMGISYTLPTIRVARALRLHNNVVYRYAFPAWFEAILADNADGEPIITMKLPASFIKWLSQFTE